MSGFKIVEALLIDKIDRFTDQLPLTIFGLQGVQEAKKWDIDARLLIYALGLQHAAE